MKKLKKSMFRLQEAGQGILLSLCLLVMSSLSAFAQAADATPQIEMADAFRAEGKIYVVVAIILLIFAGLTLYVVRIERKLSRLEKELEKH